MSYSIDTINLICADMGAPANHIYEIDGLNAICVALGGVGKWDYHKSALNEICALMGKTATFKYTIDSLNALAGSVSKYEDEAWEKVRLASGLNILLPEKLVQETYRNVVDMEAVGTFAIGGSAATLTVNSTEKYHGRNSLKLKSTLAGTNQELRMDVNWDMSLSNGKDFKLWVYPHTDPLTTIKNIYVYLFSGTGFTNSKLAIWSPDYVGAQLVIPNQWNLLSFKAWNTDAGTAFNWANITKIYVRTYKNVDTISEVSFDYMTSEITRKKAVFITFDDGNRSDYTIAYPYLKAKKMVATTYFVSSQSGGVGVLTSAQLQEMTAGGWDIANHSHSHQLTPITDKEAYKTDLETCRVFLENLGLARASKHVAYTAGSFSDLAFQALSELGYYTGRYGGTTPNLYEWRYPYINYSLVVTATTAAATIQNYITNTILAGGIPSITFHLLVASGGVDYSCNASQFYELVDWLVANSYQTLTIDEYYRLNSGAITVNHK